MRFTMIKIFKVAMTILLTNTVIISLSACSKPSTQQSDTANAATTQAINTQGTNENSKPPSSIAIQVGSDITFPPFEYYDNKTPVGFDIELMNKIAEQNHQTVNFVDTRFTNLFSGLEGKKYDMIVSAIYITPERLKKFDMIPYFTSNQVVFVKKESTYEPKEAMDLCGKKVAVLKGSVLVNQLGDISKNKCEAISKPALIIKEYPTSPEAILALMSGQADAQYEDTAAANEALKKLGDKIKITSTDSFFPMVAGVLVRKGDKSNYDFFSNGLARLKTSGEYAELLKKYGLKEPTEAEITAVMAKKS